MFLHKHLLWGAFALVLSAASVSAQSAAAGRPAKPTDLHAKAISTDTARLTWSDNATDEAEYHVEVRTGTGAWTDTGPVPPNATSIQMFGLKEAQTYYFRVRPKNINGWGAYSNEAAATGWYTSPAACVASDTVMCLGDGRYRVELTYERASDNLRGKGRSETLSQESGLFWFFSQSNVEAIVKILDGCQLNGHRWLFTTGLTDLRVLVSVIDTKTGATATYLNEGGKPFAPMNDTDALPCD
jgi:hypothetical protein